MHDGEGVIFTKHNFENPVVVRVARLICSFYRKVALDDALGRKLQDAEISVKKRAPKRKDELL